MVSSHDISFIYENIPKYEKVFKIFWVQTFQISKSQHVSLHGAYHAYLYILDAVFLGRGKTLLIYYMQHTFFCWFNFSSCLKYFFFLKFFYYLRVSPHTRHLPTHLSANFIPLCPSLLFICLYSPVNPISVAHNNVELLAYADNPAVVSSTGCWLSLIQKTAFHSAPLIFFSSSFFCHLFFDVPGD